MNTAVHFRRFCVFFTPNHERRRPPFLAKNTIKNNNNVCTPEYKKKFRELFFGVRMCVRTSHALTWTFSARWRSRRPGVADYDRHSELQLKIAAPWICIRVARRVQPASLRSSISNEFCVLTQCINVMLSALKLGREIAHGGIRPISVLDL